jgi:CheY-like chemotaxis protein
VPKILIVDDDRTMVSLLHTLLELEGYSVYSTPLGQAAIQLSREHQPDIVLMDVHLADGDGLGVLRQMRADTDLGRLRVVMTSGLDMVDECKQAGGDDFILKPYAPDQLVSTLQRILES